MLKIPKPSNGQKGDESERGFETFCHCLHFETLTLIKVATFHELGSLEGVAPWGVEQVYLLAHERWHTIAHKPILGFVGKVQQNLCFLHQGLTQTPCFVTFILMRAPNNLSESIGNIQFPPAYPRGPLLSGISYQKQAIVQSSLLVVHTPLAGPLNSGGLEPGGPGVLCP